MLLKAGVFGVVILADTAASSGGLPPFANYGIIGILFGAIVIGKMLVPRWIYDSSLAAETKRADRAEAENQRLHELLEGQTIKSLTEATLAVKDSQAWASDMKRELDRLRDVVKDLRANPRGIDGS